MEVFNLVWNFNLVYSSPLNSKLFFKMIMQLYVKNSARYIELKFQLALGNPGWKFQICHIINTFSNPVWKFDTTHAQIPYLSFFKKIKIATWQARFKWIDDRLINPIKGLEEFKSSMNFMKLSFVMRMFFFQLLAEVFLPISLSHHSSVVFFCTNKHFVFTTSFLSVCVFFLSSVFLFTWA